MLRTAFASLMTLLLSAVSPLVAADDPFVSPSKPHGVVTTLQDQPGQELWGVKITEVDGQLVGGPRARNLWLKPGTYTIQARRAVTRSGFTRGLRRVPDQLRDADLDAVSINVEAGKTYFLALDTSSYDPLDWKVVVHRVEQ